jgi:hypothetical protein
MLIFIPDLLDMQHRVLPIPEHSWKAKPQRLLLQVYN